MREAESHTEIGQRLVMLEFLTRSGHPPFAMSSDLPPAGSPQQRRSFLSAAEMNERVAAKVEARMAEILAAPDPKLAAQIEREAIKKRIGELLRKIRSKGIIDTQDKLSRLSTAQEPDVWTSRGGKTESRVPYTPNPKRRTDRRRYRDDEVTHGFPVSNIKEFFFFSTSIVSAGYDPMQKILFLKFDDQGVYRYDGVPEKVVQNLIDAPSHGSYARRHICYAFHYEYIQPSGRKILGA